MSKSDDNSQEGKGTSVSNAHTIEEIADFWDTHSLGRITGTRRRK